MSTANLTPILVSEEYEKEACLDNIVLNSSASINISYQDADEQSSISTDSVMSKDGNFDDAFTFDTKTVHTDNDKMNEDTQYKPSISSSSDSAVNSSMEVLNLSEDSDKDEEFIDRFLALNKSEEDCQNTEKERYSYDKESKQVRGRPSACVFVASLSSNLSDDVLCQSVTNHFKQWGEMKLVKVLRDPANRPYAFVQYANEEDANLAIGEGQHSILNGRTIRCEKARVNRTLYVELSNKGICEKTLKKLLLRFGELEKLVTVDDDFLGEMRSFNPKTKYKRWFCKFVYRQDAISAFANLKTKLDWNVEWTQNIEDEYSDVPEVTIDKNSIFVGHLDPRISKEELIERFETHGKIKEAILVNRPLSNFAFIKFMAKEAAAAAVERENHSMFKYKTIHVQYREMYNNYRRNSSDNRRYKLSLAPPPVNFRRRHIFNNNHRKRNVLDYNRKYTPFFPASETSRCTTSKALGHNFKARTASVQYEEDPIQIVRFRNRRSGEGNRFMDYKPQGHDQSGEFNDKYTSLFDQQEGNIEDFETEANHDDSIEIQIDSHELSSHGNTSANEDDIEKDSSFMTGAGKTGYTYSSVDNTENEPTMHITSNPSSFQYPMYYYYPSKEAPYMNAPMQPVPSGNFRGSFPNNLPPSNSGYYYPYHNYGTPGSPNNQMPVYPMYVYHPVSILQTESTAHFTGKHPNSNSNSLNQDGNVNQLVYED